MATKENVEKWLKRVEESNGTIKIVDASLNKKVAECEKLRRAFNEKCKKLAKDEILLKESQYTLLREIRESLEKQGDDDVWTKDIQFVTEALEEDVYVVHLVKPQAR